MSNIGFISTTQEKQKTAVYYSRKYTFGSPAFYKTISRSKFLLRFNVSNRTVAFRPSITRGLALSSNYISNYQHFFFCSIKEATAFMCKYIHRVRKKSIGESLIFGFKNSDFSLQKVLVYDENRHFERFICKKQLLWVFQTTYQFVSPFPGFIMSKLWLKFPFQNITFFSQMKITVGFSTA